MSKNAKKPSEALPYSFVYPQSIWVDPQAYKAKIFLQPSDDKILYEILFRAEVGEASFKKDDFAPTPFINLSEMNAISQALPNIRNISIAHSILSKIGYAHPGNKGLLPKSLVLKGKKAPLISALYNSLDGQVEVEFATVIPKEWDNNFGWFPKDSEGNISGDLYLAPYSDSLNKKNMENNGHHFYSDFNQDYYWALFHKDFKVPLGKALWNDVAAIEALIKRAEANDSEAELTQQALLNPTLMSADTVRLAQKKSLEAARESFRLTTIKVDEIKHISNTLWGTSKGLFQSKMSGFYRIPLNFHSLNNDSIYKTDRTKPRAVNAVAEIDLEGMDEGFVKHFLKNLADEIRERELGYILVSDSPRRLIYITKNVEAFLEHKDIFVNMKPFTYYASRQRNEAPRIGIDEELRSPEAFIAEVLEPKAKSKVVPFLISLRG